MTAEIIFRILGFIVFGLIGWQAGTIWAGTSELTAVSLRYILTLALVGGLLGALVSPWLTTRPAAWLRRTIRELTAPQLLAGTVGLLIGLVVAALAALPLSYLPSPFRSILPTVVAILFGYIGIVAMVLRQRDIFALFRRRSETIAPDGEPAAASAAGKQEDVLLLDTSVIIDGRIADVAATGFINASLLIPRFVLAELQYIADSPDSLRRNRGRRGLEMLNQMQQQAPVPVRIVDMDVEGTRQVDAKLVQLARQLKCPIVTNDYNLNRVAGLQGVKVLNVNELSNAVKSVVLPGEAMAIRVIQEGKEVGQGIGYLDDGTMVVIENGRRYMDSDIEVTVTKVLQTNAGRMIFATPNR
ncbi:MAG: twitching motility protein PilT [Anaerolineae bacterium CG2_30_64_16]|nr:MAG: twitching motility protein PilT [Anaerolineae bacterium CG2_30_64_16]